MTHVAVYCEWPQYFTPMPKIIYDLYLIIQLDEYVFKMDSVIIYGCKS
jgi:hypothetical protein